MSEYKITGASQYLGSSYVISSEETNKDIARIYSLPQASEIYIVEKKIKVFSEPSFAIRALSRWARNFNAEESSLRQAICEEIILSRYYYEIKGLEISVYIRPERIKKVINDYIVTGGISAVTVMDGVADDNDVNIEELKDFFCFN